MAAHRHGLGFRTEERGMCVSLVDGRLRFGGDGSSISGFEVQNGTCRQLLCFAPKCDPHPTTVTPEPRLFHVDIECDPP